MASTVPYLKGIRTKYLNTLKSEIKYGYVILACDREQIDTKDSILRTNKCIDKIERYIDKLEIQTDKLTEKVDDSDNTFIQQCVDENEDVFCKATEYCSDLRNVKEWLSKTKHSLKWLIFKKKCKA